MDFVGDRLYDGRKLRALTLIDPYTRECFGYLGRPRHPRRTRG
jgi:hypothetical protein